MAALRASGKAKLADDLIQRLDAGRKRIEHGGKIQGRVVFGQIHIANHAVEPYEVATFPTVLEEGYFAGPVMDVDRLAFRAHGYAPLEVALPSNPPSPFAVLGDVTLRPLIPRERARLRGTILFEGAPVEAKVTLSVGTESFGKGSYGTEPGVRRPKEILVPLGKNGSFQVVNLSPIKYFFHVEAPGYVSQSRAVDFKPGRTLQLVGLRLESPRPVKLTFVVGADGKFDPTAVSQTVELQAGARWKATSDIYSTPTALVMSPIWARAS